MNYVKHLNFNGTEAKEIPCIRGNGAPSDATEGAIGCLYIDIDTGEIYKCIGVSSGAYVWMALDEFAQKLAEDTLQKTGWSANKNLGTDENGNVIEKPDIFSKDTSAWKPVEYMNDIAWTDFGEYWDTNGTHTNTAYTQAYRSTESLIKIEPNCSYSLGSFDGVYTLYDANGKNGARATVYTNPNVPLTFETNANQYYIGISHRPSGSFTVDRVSLIRTTISEKEYNALPTQFDTLKPLYGKSVVCFGDSLFGMNRGEDSTPSFVAVETGATVYNVGFGGCRMARIPFLADGYNLFGMWALSKAIADGDWSLQNEAAPNGSDYFPDQLELLKSIDFNKVNIVVIHYGTNDFGAGSAPVTLDDPSNPLNVETLCGALRYSIENLLGRYKHLRIYVSLPVFRYWLAPDKETIIGYSDDYKREGSNLTLVDFVEALRKTANEYKLPVIDGYYGLGINKINAPHFLNVNDGTHLNTIGRERFGRYIGANLIAW